MQHFTAVSEPVIACTDILQSCETSCRTRIGFVAHSVLAHVCASQVAMVHGSSKQCDSAVQLRTAGYQMKLQLGRRD